MAEKQGIINLSIYYNLSYISVLSDSEVTLLREGEGSGFRPVFYRLLIIYSELHIK